mgnify:CR=1 FL=1
MANNLSLNLIDLDFDTLKNNLKNYLKQQDQFKDYDFDGASINVLLDVLTYNTQKNAFFYNMAISEAFLDSAQLRDSILSKAKELNYLPRSARSARATLTVNFTATSDNQPYIIPKGSSFATLIKDTSYVFSVAESIECTSSNTSFQFTADVYEGVYVKDSYIFKSTLEPQRFRLTNRNVDTSSLTVTVYEDGSTDGIPYIFTNTLLDVGSTSKVFFLQASENGYYEILFGDNIIGKKPGINSLIVLDYRVTVGSKANGAKVFVPNFDPTSPYGELLETLDITVDSISSDGTEEESIDSIKYYAPRHFPIQQRTVIPSDYEISLKEAFPEINAVSAIGGEDMIPPEFGKIFIAVDISDVDGFPDSKKTEYYNFIKRRSAMKPVFIDPKFTYFQINSLVRYNTNITSSSKLTIETIVSNAISNYNEEMLDDFNVLLRTSKLSEAINDSDMSIVSNTTRVLIYKKLEPVIGEQFSTVIYFDVPFDVYNEYLDNKEKPVYSTTFTYRGVQCHIEDDSLGNIWVVRNSDANKINIIGEVNYDSGTIEINNLLVDTYEGSSIKIYCDPRDKDIQIRKDTIGTIEPDGIDLEIEAIRE